LPTLPTKAPSSIETSPTPELSPPLSPIPYRRAYLETDRLYRTSNPNPKTAPIDHCNCSCSCSTGLQTGSDQMKATCGHIHLSPVIRWIRRLCMAAVAPPFVPLPCDSYAPMSSTGALPKDAANCICQSGIFGYRQLLQHQLPVPTHCR
jgi:hypothetical protein